MIVGSLTIIYFAGLLRPELYFTLLHWMDLVRPASIGEIVPSLLFSLERQILLSGALLVILFLYKRQTLGLPVFRMLIVALVFID
jgi:hypothetical protein